MGPARRVRAQSSPSSGSQATSTESAIPAGAAHEPLTPCTTLPLAYQARLEYLSEAGLAGGRDREKSQTEQSAVAGLLCALTLQRPSSPSCQPSVCVGLCTAGLIQLGMGWRSLLVRCAWVSIANTLGSSSFYLLESQLYDATGDLHAQHSAHRLLENLTSLIIVPYQKNLSKQIMCGG